MALRGSNGKHTYSPFEMAPQPVRDRWKSVDQLVEAMQDRIDAGKAIHLSPDTARVVLFLIAPREFQRDKRFHVDLFSSGSCIYRLDHEGEIAEPVAWAKSSIVANRAFDSLTEQYRHLRFLQKRGAWVENETPEKPPPPPIAKPG